MLGVLEDQFDLLFVDTSLGVRIRRCPTLQLPKNTPGSYGRTAEGNMLFCEEEKIL
jgi:hypothetical protein